MPTLVAVTQRVMISPETGERRDALDQRWVPFLEACGMEAVPVPNRLDSVARWAAALDVGAVLLSGGEDLAELGGTAPERDITEYALLDWARNRELPVLGVCRGLQLLAYRSGVMLRRVEGHVALEHTVCTDGGIESVNSFHRWGFDRAPSGFTVTAAAEDGTVEAMRHATLPISGIMWHPERYAAPRAADLELVRSALRGLL
jgi:N5-(cytidine 5'-diphosphoramidyl)-L-glutamine hydrolase